jgi:hypothetical protein
MTYLYVYTTLIPQVAQKHTVHIPGVANIQAAVSAEVKRQSGKDGSTVYTATIKRFRG